MWRFVSFLTFSGCGLAVEPNSALNQNGPDFGITFAESGGRWDAFTVLCSQLCPEGPGPGSRPGSGSDLLMFLYLLGLKQTPNLQMI